MPPRSSESRIALISTLVLVATCVLLYGRTPGFAYVWDDYLIFLDNAALLNAPLSWSLLSTPILPGTSYFRPLVLFSWFAEFRLAGQNPAISHGINLAIYTINVLLVYLLARRYFAATRDTPRAMLPLASAFLYAIHPSLVEATAWVSGRFDLMVTTFILASACLALSARIDTRAKALAIFMTTLGALFSKELGIVIPGILACLWLATENPPKIFSRETLARFARSGLPTVGASALACIAYLIIRRLSMHEIYHEKIELPSVLTTVFMEGTPFQALAFYLHKSLLPFGAIGSQYPWSDHVTDTAPAVVAAWIIGAAAMITVTFLMRLRAVWWFGAYLLCLLPVLHIIPITINDNIGHDRFMTTSLAFLSIFAVDLATARKLRRSGLLLGAALAWTVAAIITTLTVLPFWKNDRALWGWEYRMHPDSSFTRYNYINALFNASATDAALALLESRLRQNGALDVDEQILYGEIRISKQDPEGAKYLEALIQILPKFHEMDDADGNASDFMLSRRQISSIYATYANALMMFDGDLDGAQHNNHIAQWYAGRDDPEMIPLKYFEAAIRFARGDYESAIGLYESLSRYKFYKAVTARSSFNHLLAVYCQAPNADTASCNEAVRRGLIPKEQEASP